MELDLVNILRAPATPLWIFALATVAMFFKTYPLIVARLTERKVAEDGIAGNQWKRFQDEIERLAKRVEVLEGRCRELQHEVEECHRERAEERAGRLAAEAQLVGRGNAQQEAAGIVAAERLADRAARDKDRR